MGLVFEGVSDANGGRALRRRNPRHIHEVDDSLRRFLCSEPRGNPAGSFCVLLPACDPAATYIKVRGRWTYLYRAIDSNGCTVEFWLSEHRDLSAAKRFFKKAFARHGRPERVVIDGSRTSREAINSCDTIRRLQDRSRRRLEPLRIRQSQYLNNRVEHDHRRIRPMLGFKSFRSAVATLPGIEMMPHAAQAPTATAHTASLSIAKQFETLVAAI